MRSVKNVSFMESRFYTKFDRKLLGRMTKVEG